MRRFLDALCGVPTDHPWATLLAAIVLTLLSVAGIKRLSADASLDAMFPQGDAAADVLVHVLDQFGTADELLVLVTLPEDAQSPDPQRLLDYADRFQKAVADSPAGPLSDGVVYRVEPDIIQFVQHELAPAGLFYLDNQTLAQVMDRLSPDGMRRQLDHDQAMLAQPGPAAGAMAKALMQDPLALHDFLLPKLREAEPMGTYQNSDALIAPDGKSLLIRVLGKKPPTDLPYSRALSAAIVDACRSAQPRGLNVQFSGAYAIAAASERSIRRDAITSIVSSVALLMALFLVAFRRPLRLFHLAFAPVALGVLWGFGIYGLVLRNLSPVAAVIGGVLAGMGIDYSVLFLSRYESVRGELGSRAAARTTLRETAPAVFAAWITSVAGFLAIGWSTVKALRDFSILGTVGLAGSFLGAAFVVPALLSIAGGDDLVQRRAFRFSLEPMQRWADRHRGFSVGSCVLLMLVSTVVAAWPGPSLFEAESDLTVMHPRPNPALDTVLVDLRRFAIVSVRQVMPLAGGGAFVAPAHILIIMCYSAEASTRAIIECHVGQSCPTMSPCH